MLSAGENKQAGKSGQRHRKKKAGQKTKAGEHTSATDQLRDAAPTIAEGANRESDHDSSRDIEKETGYDSGRPGAEMHHEAAEDVSTQVPVEALPDLPGATEMAGEPLAAAEIVPVSPQAIADACRDYTATSLEHAFAFFGKLAAARSPAEAFELQMQFAKEACEAFVAGTQKIADLQGQLARQRVMNLEGFVAKITQTTFELRATRH